MTDYKNIIFPFSAVQGQPLFKLALLLATINPAIGGVLISGPRGSAKSTLARGITDLLPVQQENESSFVTLPLGATEEMLIGTLDIESILKDKQLTFSPGLLKKAHGGVLYVDEVNLLADHLVDQLLDVASSGVNVVERDGISHRHEARFTLIGTMNPDEGELRPQLQDRFGLMVELDNQYSIEDRIAIIKTRQAFEENPGTFCDLYQVKQIVLQQQISDAQRLLPLVNCSDDILIDIATRCHKANVEGLRADIMMHRASITHAAWCGRTEVTLEDISQVAPLVLLHRAQTSTAPPHSDIPPSSSDNNDSGGFSRPKPATEKSDQQADTNTNNGEEHTTRDHEIENSESADSETDSSEDGEWGAMPAENGETQKTDRRNNTGLPSLATHSTEQSFNVDTRSKRAGNNNSGGHVSPMSSDRHDWFATLTASLGQWPPAKFAFKKCHTGEQKCHLILLDTSASTLSDSLASVAKSVVMNITEGAYLQRDKISLLGFGNDKVETIIKAGRAPKQVATLLDNISALGGTPLRLALQTASDTIKQLKQRYPSLQLCCYLITDGRSRMNLTDLKLKIPTLLIDIEKAQIKRGRGQLLANQLDAQYMALTV